MLSSSSSSVASLKNSFVTSTDDPSHDFSLELELEAETEIFTKTENKKYTWTADLVWRNRTFKDVHVFYDSLAGQLGFSKSSTSRVIFSMKFPEKCYGINAIFEEHLVILHAIDRVHGLENDQIQSQIDIFYFYLTEESEVDRFRIVLNNSLQSLQGRKRFLVVLNRESGQGRAGKVYESTVLPMLQIASASHVLRESEYNRHISLFATQFNPSSIDGIILIGGDGTVNEFLNGLFSRKDFALIQGSLPISLIPCGVKLQLAARFSLGDSVMAVFSALRAKTFNLYPIAFVQARRRFYAHSYLQIRPKKRTYIKIHYLNTTTTTTTTSSNTTHSLFLNNDLASDYSVSADSIVSKGPNLQFYHKFIKLDRLGKDISTSTAAFGPNSDLKLTNTFDPTMNHPIALMNQNHRLNPIQKLWNTMTCSKLFGSSTNNRNIINNNNNTNNNNNSDTWPSLLAMTKAGYLQIEDTVSYPPSQNKDRWYVDGEIIGTESVYFESLETPILITVPPNYILEANQDEFRLK